MAAPRNLPARVLAGAASCLAHLCRIISISIVLLMVLQCHNGGLYDRALDCGVGAHALVVRNGGDPDNAAGSGTLPSMTIGISDSSGASSMAAVPNAGIVGRHSR